MFAIKFPLGVLDLLAPLHATESLTFQSSVHHTNFAAREYSNENYSMIKTAGEVTTAVSQLHTAEEVNYASDLEDEDEQYIQMINYALWEVIENGVTLPKTTTVEGVVIVMSITTSEEKAQRRLEDAKKLLEAVEKRFGGNAATRKTQRNLLKQQYENFTTPSSEMLDQTFDRLQKLVSQLELLDEKLSQEDVNQKLLRCLSLEWNTHAVAWRNKTDLDTMSTDDLYSNLKVYEPEVKEMSSSSSSTQNMAFVSSS
ncbi:hypothetical protein Tco_1148154, partial [Tanacetum coccineum]